MMSIRRQTTRVLFLVQNLTADDIALVRARELARRLPERYDCRIAERRSAGAVAEIWSFWRAVRLFRPDVICCQNEGLTALVPALLARWRHGVPFVIDTGDIAEELARKLISGWFARWKMILTERLTLRTAAAIVVRGTFHRRYLAARGRRHVWVVQDGVDVEDRPAERDQALRMKLGLSNRFVVGVMGSSIWNERLQLCYGWELVETIALLKEPKVSGLMVGGGDGIAWLKRRAAELGVQDRIVFTGYVPHRQVRSYLQQMDTALCTQTNDPVGWARTTGKLPEYLAAGCYVLASAVGEAVLVLPPSMLVPYDGPGRDNSYPGRLAERIRQLVPARRRLAAARPTNRAIARARFDYRVLSTKLAGCFGSLAGRGPGDGARPCA